MLTFAAQAALLIAFASPQVPAVLPPALLNIVTERAEPQTAGALLTLSVQLEQAPDPVLRRDGERVLVGLGAGTKMSDLLAAYAELEGLSFSLNGQVQEALANTPVRMIGAPSELAPEEVTPFVEGLLRDANLLLTKNAGPRSYSLWSLPALRERISQRAQLATEGIGELRRHPALVMQATVSLEHIDVRQLSANLRPMFQDSIYQSLMNTGQANTMFLCGTGSELANAIEMLSAADAAAREASGRTQQQAQHAVTAPEPAPEPEAVAGPKANTERPKLVTRIFEVGANSVAISSTAEGLTRGRFSVEGKGLFFEGAGGAPSPWPAPRFWTDRDTNRVMVQAAERDFPGITADLELAARLHRMDN